jgi:hypothetical protein
MKKLNIITPCTRPQNLLKIHESIFENVPSDLDVTWWVVPDFSKPFEIELPGTKFHTFYTYGKGVVGHDQRNYALTYFPLEGHVKFLDDDNILHPNYYEEVAPYIGTDKIIIVDQYLRDNTKRLEARPENVFPNHIDCDQYTFPITSVEYTTVPLVYNGDGIFITMLYAKCKDRFVYINQPASYYNFLR